MKLHPSLTTVTPISKLLAMLLFVLLPFLGFYLGMQYGRISSNLQMQDTHTTYWEKQKTKIDSLVSAVTYPAITYKAPPSGWKTYTNTVTGYELALPPTYPQPISYQMALTLIDSGKNPTHMPDTLIGGEIQISTSPNFLRDFVSVDDEYTQMLHNKDARTTSTQIAKTTVNNIPVIYTKTEKYEIFRFYYPNTKPQKVLAIAKTPAVSSRDKEFLQIISTVKLLNTK